MQPPLNEQQKEEVVRRIARSAAFQRVFRGKDGEIVLDELKKQLSSFNPDPYVNAFKDGKQFMWDFIQKVLEQDVEKAREVLGNAPPEKRREAK